MIDLEEQLRSSLREYGDAIVPGPPPMAPFVPVVTTRTRRTDVRRVLVAASVLVGLVAGTLWLVGRTRSTTVAPDPQPFGSWELVPPMPLAPRKTPSVLWTGSEFLVWGGETGNVGFQDGAALDPATGTWRAIAANARVRGGGNAVWTGHSMVVLSGAGGEAYDPATDSWSSMPELPAEEADPGFSDAVMVGGALLGVGIWPDPVEQGATRIRVWTFDDVRQQWTSRTDTTVAATFPGSFVSQRDQFFAHQVVATDDGFVVWDGGRLVFRLAGELRGTLTSDRWYVDGVSPLALTAVDGKPAMLAIRSTGDASDLRLTTFADGEWSPWTVLGPAGIGIPRTVLAGDHVVLLGMIDRGSSPTPQWIDPVAGTAVVLDGFPISTVIDQGAGWSGSALLVCGGQRSTSNTAEISTDDPGPVSNECAIWRP